VCIYVVITLLNYRSIPSFSSLDVFFAWICLEIVRLPQAGFSPHDANLKSLEYSKEKQKSGIISNKNISDIFDCNEQSLKQLLHP
jgi:hypothetical protein